MRYIKKFITPIICIIFTLIIYNIGAVITFATESDAATQPTDATETHVETSLKNDVEGDFIYLDLSEWKNTDYVTDVSAQISEESGRPFFTLESRYVTCEKISDAVWRYDLSNLHRSTTISGGIKKGEAYSVMFFISRKDYNNDISYMTYELTMGAECVGDTAVHTGTTYYGSKDEGTAYYGEEVEWLVNSEKYGPHYFITAEGEIFGKKMFPDETAVNIIGEWITNFSNKPYCDPVKVIAQAMKDLNVQYKDIEEIYNYVASHSDFNISEMNKVLQYLKKAYESITDPPITAPPTTESTSDDYIGAPSGNNVLVAENRKSYDVKRNKEYLFFVKTSKKCYYTSSDRRVATITIGGIMKTKAMGFVIITCKYDGKIIRMTVYVTDGGYKEYYSGKKVNLTSAFKTVKNYKSGKWSSSNPKVVFVKNGKIDCKKHGSATIYLKVGNKKYKIKVYSYSKAKLKEKSLQWIKEYAYNPKSVKAKKINYKKKFKAKMKFTYLNREPKLKSGVFVGYFKKGKFDGYLVKM